MPAQNLEAYLMRFGPPQLRVILADSEAEFVDAVELSLESAIQHMEAGAQYNYNRGERALAHELVGCLGGGGLYAQNEAHSNGHVDITVVHWRHVGWRMLGECKIYRYPAYHIGGCEQILGRYATGRLPRAFCLDFFQEEEIQQKMQGIRDQMDADMPLQQQGASQNHAIHWAFLTTHRHSSGEDVTILNLGCNVYFDGA
jgi:hypothetical protein